MDANRQPTTRPPLVALAGNIGAGKTAFAGRLCEQFGWWLGRESLDDNPFLEDFYKEMSRWSFHVEMSFLGNRFHQHSKAMCQGRGAVLDRSLYEDRHIFVEVAKVQGILSERDYQTYVNVYNAVVPSLRVPDLFVFISAPIPVLVSRIARRGRPFEKNIPVAYLEQLEQRYELWSRTLAPSRVVRIESHLYDFATSSLTSPQMVQLFAQVSETLAQSGVSCGPQSLQ